MRKLVTILSLVCTCFTFSAFGYEKEEGMKRAILTPKEFALLQSALSNAKTESFQKLADGFTLLSNCGLNQSISGIVVLDCHFKSQGATGYVKFHVEVQNKEVTSAKVKGAELFDIDPSEWPRF